MAEHDGGWATWEDELGFRDGSDKVQLYEGSKDGSGTSKLRDRRGRGRQTQENEKGERMVRVQYTTPVIEAWNKPIGRRKSEWSGFWKSTIEYAGYTT